MPKNTIIGGGFQDFEGNPLANGYLVMELFHDAQQTDTPGEVVAGLKIRVPLDNNGNVAGTVSVWPTDQLLPTGNYYIVNAFRSDGTKAWAYPQNLTVPSSPSPYNIGNWVPTNPPGGFGNGTSGILLQTNGTNNGSQSKFNAVAGSGMTITDDGIGDITFAVTAGSNGPRTRGWRGWVSDGEAGVHPTQGQGCIPGVGLAGGAGYLAINPTATETSMMGITTTAVAGSLSYLDWQAGNDYNMVTLGVLGLAETRMKLGSTTNIRCWIGLGTAIGNFYESDAPPETTVAFRYSTHAGDSTWQCVVTDGTTQVIANSGVTANTNGHVFGIQFSSPNALFYIDGVKVGTVSINTTTLTTSTLFNGFFTVDNVGTANNVSAAVAYYYWDTQP